MFTVVLVRLWSFLWFCAASFSIGEEGRTGIRADALEGTWSRRIYRRFRRARGTMEHATKSLVQARLRRWSYGTGKQRVVSQVCELVLWSCGSHHVGALEEVWGLTAVGATETKVLKQLLRDRIQPDKDLGHSDKGGKAAVKVESAVNGEGSRGGLVVKAGKAGEQEEECSSCP